MGNSQSSISTKEMSSDDETEAEETEILNGKPSKEISKVSELTNNDPLEYFSRFLGIPEMILEHLKGRNLIIASEVSPRYYNFIASSKVLMQKIKVVSVRDFDFNGEDLDRIPKVSLYAFNFLASSKDLSKIKIVFRDKSATPSEDFNLLKSSSRLYQNIELRRRTVNIEDENGNHRKVGDYVTHTELDIFQSKTREWKNVNLANVYFRKKFDLWRLLSVIESSLEKISVYDDGLLSFEDPSSEIESFEALKFPKLKKLRIRFNGNRTSGETLTRFFLKSVAIEELFLFDDHGKIDKDIVQDMLVNFDKIRSLNIVSSITNQIFEEKSWEKFQFKLKALSLLNFRSLEPFSSNCLNFLKSQNDYLEELIIILRVADKETFDVIMKLPKLKSLFLLYFEAFPENEVPNEISTSITELTLFKCNSLTLKNLLNLMPKVRNLTLTSIDEENFKMLKLMKRKFEILRVCELKGVTIKELEEIMTEKYTSLKIVKSTEMKSSNLEHLFDIFHNLS